MGRQTLISVFTPTYNREHSIRRVYDCLKKQTYKNFEWILIDDASRDNTDLVIKRFIADKILTINHVRFATNRGKHIAHNKALEIAIGELFTIIDSDWEIEHNALEYVIDSWSKIPDKEKNTMSGMYFGCKLSNGSSHSSSIGADSIITNDIDMVYKLKVTGDRWTIRKTEVLRKFPFPQDFVGQFYPEGIVWKQIGAVYNVKVFSKELCIIHYDNANSLMRGKRSIQMAAKYVCVMAADHLNNYLSYARYRPLMFAMEILYFFVYSFFTLDFIGTWKTLNATARVLVVLFSPLNTIGLLAFCGLQVYRKINRTSPFK